MYYLPYQYNNSYYFIDPYYNYNYYFRNTEDCNSKDCPPGATRIHNYYQDCLGLVLVCRDACYNPYTGTYCAIGPTKSCGACVGYSSTWPKKWPW